MSDAGRRFAARALAHKQRFVAELPSARAQQAEFLRECLDANHDTEIGRAHGFATIRDADEYRRRVPIRDYDALAPFIERARAGAPTVLTAEAPIAYLTTSGTTGPTKVIPLTRAQGTYHTYGMWIAAGAMLEVAPELVERD